MEPDDLLRRSERLSRIAADINRLADSGRPVPAGLDAGLREVMRLNPDAPRGTPLDFGSPLMAYLENRGAVQVASRRLGIELE